MAKSDEDPGTGSWKNGNWSPHLRQDKEPYGLFHRQYQHFGESRSDASLDRGKTFQLSQGQVVRESELIRTGLTESFLRFHPGILYCLGIHGR